MRITLLSINAKYVHSSLAVWYIAAGMNRFSSGMHETSVAEATINMEIDAIADLVIEKDPDLLGISTYIWNARLLPKLLAILRNRIPTLKIVLGGPEAGCNAKHWLLNGADYVLSGDGEYSFPLLVRAIVNDSDFENVPGLNRLVNGEFKKNVIADSAVIADRDYINPYSNEYFDTLGGRIAYIEASRGCPYKCAYCLSGDSAVTFFPIETIKEEITLLANSGTRTIKFVDRTFNCNPKRAYEIWQFIIGLDTKCCFHFEVAGDLFDDSLINLLQMAPLGRIQLEIGLQSFYERTLEAVCRKTDLLRAKESIKKLIHPGNIHIHNDLIAGLPYETLSIFKDSFNQAYALGAHNLQLGFLKILHGSLLEAKAYDFGLIYSMEPPYEIISTPWLSSEDIKIIKTTENALQHTYNKSRFLSVISYCLTATNITAFDFYYGLGRAVQNHAMPLREYTEQVYNYCLTLPGIEPNKLRDHFICDMLSMTKGKSMPKIFYSYGEMKKKAVTIVSERLGRVVDYDEVALLSDGAVAYADRAKRDLVLGVYEVNVIEIK
ncbi:MAG: B12-binding domain-containing radical SAM protein [Lachnospiraceae bacterium]|jgi:radical SAM superfamily enzyme YgiQ (UPF0313 family)|nr:B12-binding domain-containing radical SAM protein [Lachnospiraceae bacterium]